MVDFDDLEKQIDGKDNNGWYHENLIRIALKIMLGFWRDYRRANGIE